MIKQKITEEAIDNWVGNRGYASKRDEFMLELLYEFANGSYSVEDFKHDVLSYQGGN